ncbi:flagellin hook IN motif-containing protein [Methylobacterium sp. WSM2598]|uniref:flagellin hook IN motif-containing protein n=1 Tax=Methylobacterium sp. WSM2598 TaxID=398261 RepID=UPI0003655F1B|nr:flagellin hook IN motif-containing protein [Methylobacterium sp. WSM2598]
MSSITLSAATRQNLLSLQDTASLLATTQNRLATSKKVNTALDNPTNFFTADGLSSRSTALSSLLDSVSNGIQTIQAANTGLTKVQTLTDQLKSVAQQALASANSFSVKATSVSTALTGASAQNLLSTGATQAVSDTALSANATATAATVTAGTAYSNGVATYTAGSYTTLTASATVTLNGTAIALATGDDINAAVTKINAQSATTGVTVAASSGKLVFTGSNSGAQFTYAATGSETGLAASGTTTNGAGASSTTLTINGTTITVATGSTESQVINAINAVTSTTGVTASDNSGKIKLTGAADGSSITVQGGTGSQVGFGTTASTTAGTFSPSAATLAIAVGFKAGDNFTVNGQSVNIAAGDTLGSIAQKVSTATSGTVSASYDATNRKFTFTAADTNTAITLGNGSTATSLLSNLGFNSPTTFAAGLGAPGSSSALAGKSLTVQVGSGPSATFTFGSAAGQISTLTQLNSALAAANAQASIDTATGRISITTANDSGTDDLKITASGTGNPFNSGTSSAVIGGDGLTARNGLVSTFNNLLTQIDQLAADSGYNGVNLLAGDTLKISFNEKNTSTLSVQGSTVSYTQLGLSVLSQSDFQENSAINKVIKSINTAASSLKSQASSLGANLAVVQNRQDFTKQMINVLDTGAANLTNADLNEEAANSQALSTRNSLGISALSLANQAQQSVLQLLR